MTANFLDQIKTPTLVLDQTRAQANLRRMAAKAAAQQVRFRPHFKTHQSAEIGEWFRAEGVRAITVSSMRMAAYFAAHGWDDILVAFPVNLREMEEIRTLAAQVRLGLLVESGESVERLAAELPQNVDIWLKIDSGCTARVGCTGHRYGFGVARTVLEHETLYFSRSAHTRRPDLSCPFTRGGPQNMLPAFKP